MVFYKFSLFIQILLLKYTETGTGDAFDPKKFF
jgi:hypothetical protein